MKQIVFLWKLSWFGSDLRSFKSVKAGKLWGCFWGEKIWLHQMGHPKEIWNHHFSNKFILIWLRGNWADVLGWSFYNRPLMCWFKWIFHFSWIYVCYLQWHKHSYTSKSECRNHLCYHIEENQVNIFPLQKSFWLTSLLICSFKVLCFYPYFFHFQNL